MPEHHARRLRIERLEYRRLLAADALTGAEASAPVRNGIGQVTPPPIESTEFAVLGAVLGPYQRTVQLDFSSTEQASTEQAPTEQTTGYNTVISNGPSANRVDIVILGDGYTASQIDTDYVDHVNGMLDYLFNQGQDPYPRYAKFFNAHRINTTSNESGADKPLDNIFVDTAFDARYSCSNIERLICVNNSKVNAAKNTALADAGFSAEMQYISVNDAKYGGSGGSYAVFAGANRSANELALHEVAHSFDNLADEYGGSPNYTGSDPSEVNVTTDSDGAKWQRWLGYDQPGIGTIDAYQGGRYFDAGIYRPSNNSKMRSLGRPFDAVSREKIILDIYDLVDPVDDHRDNSQTISEINPSLWVVPIDDDVQDIQWSVDGVDVAGAIDSTFQPNDFGFGAGIYTVAARVYDATDWVRHQLSKLEQTVAWTVESLPVPRVRSVSVNQGDASRSQLTSVSVEFDTKVNVSAASFALINRLTLETVSLQVTSSSPVTGTVAELTFLPSPPVFQRQTPTLNSLIDGNYELVVIGSQVTASDGNQPMGEDYRFGNAATDAFFRLFGDSDGDRDVDGQDYGRFGLTFLQNASDENFNPWLDMVGDGDVDGQDYGQFVRKFLTNMPF